MSSDTKRDCWSHLPEVICEQARGRWPAGVRAAGPGDGYVYEWASEEPPADYCGPLPLGRLVGRTRPRRR